MNFLRKTWRLLVAIKDGLVMLFMLMLVLGVVALAALSVNQEHKTSVPLKTALLLQLDGTLVEKREKPRSVMQFITNPHGYISEIEVHQLIQAIQRATKDKRVDAIVLDLEYFDGAPQALLQSVGNALKQFRAAGKPIIAYASEYQNDSYYLAAHANEIWLPPMGTAFVDGPFSSGMYFKEILDKLGIRYNVFHVGSYKSAIEPFTRTAPSAAALEASKANVDGLWASYVADMHAVRPDLKLNQIVTRYDTLVQQAKNNLALAAKNAGLIDRIGTREQFEKSIVTRVGKNALENKDGYEPPYTYILMDDYVQATKSPRPEKGTGVGLIYVTGEITDGTAYPGTSSGDGIAKLIHKASQDSQIKALVVRIDSPGGSAVAAEKIRRALADLKTRGIPVVASFGGIAASGAYWLSTPADEIFAQPTSITGSIGVYAMIPDYVGTLEKIGIHTSKIQSTPFSGQPDSINGINPATSRILQAHINDIYTQFIGHVAKGRGMTTKHAEEIAQGRVWLGNEARRLNLVTSFGGLNDAIAAAAKRARLTNPEEARIIEIEDEGGLFGDLPVIYLSRAIANAYAPFIAHPHSQRGAQDPVSRIAIRSQVRTASAIAQAISLTRASGLQARCLACASYVTTARLSPEDARHVAQLLPLLQ